ncbi:hypothetical protein ALP02_200070 [Pseudomonas coronafaciens pv. garcae]|nr:hypothetical protein ALP02_200070 [Pseudomonas coronafaciens pv. garcae]
MLLVETTLIYVVLHQQASNSELLTRWSKKRPSRGSTGEMNLRIGKLTSRLFSYRSNLMSLNNFVTYVIRMPDDTASRTALTSELNQVVIRNGGVITGTSVEDEMTLNELFEARMNDLDVQEARREARELATAEYLQD